jgi:hypothetical protein
MASGVLRVGASAVPTLAARGAVGEPFSTGCPAPWGTLSATPFYINERLTRQFMSSDTKHLPTTEPVGIVISSGPQTVESPRFWAYVWAPAPEGDAEAPSKAA